MKAWDDIVNKALLGSEKTSLTLTDLPVEIAEEFDIEVSQDKEDTFLKISALAYQFRQSGAKPLKATNTAIAEAKPESRRYCSAKANAVLKSLLEGEHLPLIQFWLTLCLSKEQLALPETIPSLLNIAKDKKNLRGHVIKVTGERGKWLCSLNPEWNFTSLNEEPEKVWSEGSSLERRELFQDIRNIDPEKGRKLLESSWATEGANEKLAFLEIMKTNISAMDLQWLESLREKSQRVNAAILELLKLIPSSSIVQEYIQTLSACISIKTGKALLGMINKIEIAIDESFDFPESIFKTGIENLSSNKNISDAKNTIAQLLMSVPPSFLNDYLQRTPDEIIGLLQKDKQTAFYIPAIAIASVRFRDQLWTTKLLENADKDVLGDAIITLMSGLSKEDQNRYALLFFDENPSQIIQLILANENEWSLDLAKRVLKYTANEVYQYNRNFYKQAVTLIPVGMISHLESSTPADFQKQSYWQTQRVELARLLTLKQQTLESFNP